MNDLPGNVMGYFFGFEVDYVENIVKAKIALSEGRMNYMREERLNLCFSFLEEAIKWVH